jgi:hypothetical protein
VPSAGIARVQLTAVLPQSAVHSAPSAWFSSHEISLVTVIVDPSRVAVQLPSNPREQLLSP